MRQDDILLQQRALFGGYAGLCEQAESRVDSVGGCIGAGQFRRGRVGFAHLRHGRLTEADGDGFAIHAAQLAERQGTGAQLEGLAVFHREILPARTTWRHGLKPIQ